MFPTFIITLREGVEASLVIAVAVSWLKKTGRTELLPTVYHALITAVIAALWCLGLHEDQPEYGFVRSYVLLVSAAFVLSMVIWMNRHGSRMKTEIETRLQEGTSGSRGNWGVFIFVF